MLKKELSRLKIAEVAPSGWLVNQLKAQMEGLTGKLYHMWDSVGSYSAWLGGTGESWERAPYYLDGLLPLAHYLEDTNAWDICMRFVEWTLNSQDEDGNYGPLATKDDQWSRFAMNKVLIQYYEISKDTRVLDFIKKYLQYYNELIKEVTIENWSRARVTELLYALKWLYEESGDESLLALVENIDASGLDWSDYLEVFPFPRPAKDYISWENLIKINPAVHDKLFPYHATHIVNITMGFKHPALRYYFTGEEQIRESARNGICDVIKYHGVASGCINGDEHLAGNSPTQGSELCSVVEYMFSLQTLMEVFGESFYGDLMERLAYNALPATITEDFMAHQYLQQANQVLVDVSKRDWFNNGDDANVFGLEPNFGCCTANMHQGWPKFVNTLWYKRGDNELVNMVLAPSIVKTQLGEELFEVELETQYPFKNVLKYKIINAPKRKCTLCIRIPEWCKDEDIKMQNAFVDKEQGFIKIEKIFIENEELTLVLPMILKQSQWYKGSIAIERGPLIFGLDLKEEWRVLKEIQGVKDYTISTASDWNYALANDRNGNVQGDIQESEVSKRPFSKDNPPVAITLQAKKVRDWEMVRNSAGDIPKAPLNLGEIEEVKLIPFGCTKLRISQFPTY